ncbi:type III PLP-dependent enzyme [Nonomuraea sp. NPDC050227]|uniref:type III PLP-dependent enzyme n=1 Tax=Nonomuraea sp. NPDC050227 TaxID=3364360 RepID=UPI0037BD7FB3
MTHEHASVPTPRYPSERPSTLMASSELLARMFGSPLYVYQLQEVDNALTDLRLALPRDTIVYYSVKANPHPEIIRRLHSAGCRAEISSSGELANTALAGVPPTDCLYTGPAKTVEELTLAMEAGVRRFSAESIDDLRRIGAVATKLSTKAECQLRVNAAAAGATSLRMTGALTQFGTSAAELAARADELYSVPGTSIVGLHFFPLSNARDEQSLIAEFRASLATAAALNLPMQCLDLGGGFAAPFAAPGRRPRYELLATALEQALDEFVPAWRVGSVEIAFESGRYLTAGCGSLVCTVTEVKQPGGNVFVLLDGGINHLGGMAGLGRLARPAAVPVDVSDDAGLLGTITGPLCTPADVLGRSVPIGEPAAGDLVIFPNVGAYGLTASLLGFLGRPIAPEVVVDGAATVSVSRLRLVRETEKGFQR